MQMGIAIGVRVLLNGFRFTLHPLESEYKTLGIHITQRSARLRLRQREMQPKRQPERKDLLWDVLLQIKQQRTRPEWLREQQRAMLR
jgi:hypothetical protein